MCINEQAMFGMTTSSPIVSFLPFFLMISMPATFKRIEQVSVNVTVYNYIGYGLPVEISLESTDSIQIYNPIKVSDCITEFTQKSFTFLIAVNQIGLFNITSKAIVLSTFNNCSSAGYAGLSDIVVKSFKVEAEGFPASNSYSVLLCNNDNLKTAWDFSLPHNVIRNTARAQVTFSAQLLGPALQGLGDLVEMPTGCGEQNMIRLAPNIFLYRYLSTVNTPSNENLKNDVVGHIKKGYQKQLTYKHPEGFYSAFGPGEGSSESGSIWLTAFVVGSIGQAANIITVDRKELQKSLNWIVSKQMENGCFPLIGDVFRKEIKGGLSAESPVALTAFIIASLYKSGLPLPTSVAANGKFCLSADNTGVDVYSLVLTTYAFTFINITSPEAVNSLQRLLKVVKSNEDLYWWEQAGSSNALNIEMTGYAVLSLLKFGGSNNLVIAQGAVRWISMSFNNKGGFVSTQDTIVGLEALTMFALNLPVATKHSLLIDVVESEGGRLLKNVVIFNDRNVAVQQRLHLHGFPSKINISTVGQGCVLAQATLRYNVDESALNDGFELTVISQPVSHLDQCFFQRVEVCSRYTLLDGISNMVIIIVHFPTGYSPDRNSLHLINGIERWEEDVENNALIVYLKKLESVSTCFNFIIQRLNIVDRPTAAIAKVFDYYHPELTKSVNYSLTCNEIIPVETNFIV